MFVNSKFLANTSITLTSSCINIVINFVKNTSFKIEVAKIFKFLKASVTIHFVIKFPLV